MTRSCSILLLACLASACLYSPDLPADPIGGSTGATTSGGPAPTTGEGSSIATDGAAATDGDPSPTTDDPPGTTGDDATTGTATTADPTAPVDSPPDAPTLQLHFSQIKQFDFTWAAVAGADRYQLWERVDADADFVQLGDDILGTSVSRTMPLHLRVGAGYMLKACNDLTCTPSEPLDVVDSLVDAIGFFKASNPGMGDAFGFRVALSRDGATMAVAATAEDGEDDAVESAGAVYIFLHDPTEGTWEPQTVLRAPDPDLTDYFGFTLALSEHGDTLVVGVPNDDGIDDATTDAGAAYIFTRMDKEWPLAATLRATNPGVSDLFGTSVAISGASDVVAVGAPSEDGTDDLAVDSGAVHVFTRGKGDWSQVTELGSSNADPGDRFGSSVALSAAGDILAVGATGEASSKLKIPSDNVLGGAGAVYVYTADAGGWVDEQYLKPGNPGMDDHFGSSVAISGDGTTLVVGAIFEDGPGEASANAGAAYVFERERSSWEQRAYLRASNSEAGIGFGGIVALSQTGDLLAVGASKERGGAAGVDGNQSDTSLKSSGAVYVFEVGADSKWSTPPRYVKAANPGKNDYFGALALSGDGHTLAVGARLEDSDAQGLGGEQTDRSLDYNAGAVYLY